MTVIEPTKLELLLSYARLGLRVVPIPSGSKHPGVERWQDVATTDEQLIVDWWGRWPAYGVGIVTGRQSGIFVLDVDVSGDKRGDDTLADLEATYGQLPDTWTVITGSGGQHLYFRMPADVLIVNSAGNRLGVGLDVRGEGGQVLAPGSVHPNGTPYRWDLMLNPGTVPLADAPAWLIELLSAAETRSAPRRLRSVRDGSELPGDVWSADNEWSDLLVAAGATFLRTLSDRNGGSYEQWARPGVDHVSATLYYGGSDVLKVFTSNWPGLEAEATYTKFGFWTALHHGGDFAASTRALGDEQRAERIDAWQKTVSKGVEENGKVVTKGERSFSSSSDEDDDGGESWPEPLSFGTTFIVPAFPAHLLPSWLGAFVRAQAIAKQVPLDLPGSLAISVLSVAAGGRCIIEASSGWREGLNTYTCSAMPSGSRKSAIFQVMSKPLFDVEREMKSLVEREIAAAQSSRKAAMRARDMAETEWAKASESGKDKAFEALQAAAIMAESVTVPVRPRLLADDATPEALGSLLAEQGGRIAVMSAEGDVFDLMAGRYSGTPNLGVYLKGHAGDPLVVDRKGRAAEYVSAPALTIGVSVQPEVLQSIASKPGFRGRGLLARFLYSLPANTVGERDTESAEVSQVIVEQYEAKLRELVEAMAEWAHPNEAVLTLTPDARTTFKRFVAEIEPRLHPVTGDLAVIVDWASKLSGAIMRIAGLLHLAEHVPTGYRYPVEQSTIEAAIEIGRYYEKHALAVFGFMNDWDEYREARILLDVIREEGWSEFTQRQLFRKVHSRFRSVDALQWPLDVLVDHYWLRSFAVKHPHGRPSRVFQVTPFGDSNNSDKKGAFRVVEG